MHKCLKYVQLNLYLFDTLDEKTTMIYIVKNVYLVDNLQTNFLINMNIIESECINMNILSQKIIIKECQNMLMNLSIISRLNQQIQHTVQATQKITIFSCIIQQIFIKFKWQSLLTNQDLVFSFIYKDIYNYIIDANMSFVHIQNNLSTVMTLLCHIHLNVILKYKKKSCYTDNIKNLEFAVLHLLKFIINMFKNCLSNKITIYSKQNADVTAFIAVMKTYLDLWHNHRKTVNILKSDYLQVFLKKNWEQEAAKLSKWVYSLRKKVQQLVNKKFNELHVQKWMNWSTQSTSFDFLIFVVWKMIILKDMSKQKSHVVMNIQELNQISQLNFYFLFLQTDITSAVQECHYILTMYCAFFFYQ